MDVSRATTGISLDAAILHAVTPQPTNRSKRFCKRLDAELAALPNDEARREFLKIQLGSWFERYRAWALAVDSGRLEPKAGDPDAFDYLITISDIRARQDRYPAVSA